jgi:hypothetical protein
MFGDRDSVTWKEVGQVPLCPMTPLIAALVHVAREVAPTLRS